MRSAVSAGKPITAGAQVQVAVSVEGQIVERLDPAEIDRVLLFGNVQITTQVLALLFQHGVPVSFFSGSGRYRGQICSPESGNVFVRLAQHRRYGERDFRLALARRLIRDKLRAGRRLLVQYAGNHPQEAPHMAEAAARIDEALARTGEAAGEEVLRGVEGAAAAAYFTAFDRMVRPPFRFERRSKHPAHNPVNALLNLGYTLLCGEVSSRLEVAGFDPRVGYYHGVRYGRSSLALDLIEAHRVDVVDRLTLSILNRRMLALDDFTAGPEGVRLQPEALRRYLNLYEAALGDAAPGADTPRRRIQAQVGELRRLVLSGQAGESEDMADAPPGGV